MAAVRKKDTLTEEEKVIAVIIAENFNCSFHPIVNNIPLALLPLVNSPLLDYSLEWLQRNEIDETIVYCQSQSFADEIREHCRNWRTRYGNLMKVTVISSDNCTSLGDAMRDLYSKSLLKNDFILLTGIVVGNLDLREILKKHKSSVKEDPNCVMTCVYLKKESKDATSDQTSMVDIITNSDTEKLLWYRRPGNNTKVPIPTVLTLTNPVMRIRVKEQDPHVAICSETIPLLFSDNFDYGTRDSLINGVIEQEELLGCSIRVYMPKEGYAAVVSSLKSYEDVSSAIIKRKVLPLVPERSLSSQRIRYTFDDFSCNYCDSSAIVKKKSLGDNVVIDAGTEIDPRCKIRDTVVGKHCVIKENVTINNSFLMSNVVVSKGCILDKCFIGNNSKLLPGVHLEPGVVVGPNVILGPNLKVTRCKRLVATPPEEGPTEVCPLVCGKEGKAFECIDEGDEDSCDLKWGEEGTTPDSGDESDTEEEDDGEDAVDNRVPDVEDEVSSDEEREQEFEREVKDSLLNAYRNKSLLDNVILEVNSSRHAYNVSMENVLTTVTKAALLVIEEHEGSRLSGDKLLQSIKQGLLTFEDLILNYIKKPKDQIVVLKALEELVNEDGRFLGIVQLILCEMSQERDILDDEVILFWHSRLDHKTPAVARIAKAVNKFILWLKKNQKESSDEDDDENDDD